MIKKIIIAAAALLLTCTAVFAESDIIIVPGYAGSKLYSDSDFANRVFGEQSDLAGLAVFDGALYAREPINLQKAAEYGTGNRYKPLANALCAQYPKRKVYFFSYDFTKGTESAARSLHDFIVSLEEKPVLICDSMGGLAAAKMFNLYGNFALAEKTIFVGVPMSGSVYASVAADMGYGLLPGISALYPTQQYAQDENTDFAYKSDFNALEFMKNCGNAYYAAGSGMITAAKVSYSDGALSDISYTNRGDGTVTLKSAEMPGKTAVFNMLHSKLISSPEVISWIKSVLEGNAEYNNSAVYTGYDVVRVQGSADISVSGVISQNGIYTNSEKGEIIDAGGFKTAAFVRTGSAVIIKCNADERISLDLKRFNDNNGEIAAFKFTNVPAKNGGQMQIVPGDDAVRLCIDFDSDGIFEQTALCRRGKDVSFKTETPVFSEREGTYKKPFKLRLECATDGAEIYYTTDGTDPRTGGILYDGEIDISKSCTVTVAAKKEYYSDSAAISVKYEIKKRNVFAAAFLWLAAAAAVIAAVFVFLRRRNS